jgi:DNA-binding GntR family transcriptional regulator
MSVRTGEITMPTSKTQEIVDAIVAQIRAGQLRPGDPLPTARQLREQFDVSITPVRRAIDELKHRGYVVGVPGVRVYVADAPPTA